MIDDCELPLRLSPSIEVLILVLLYWTSLRKMVYEYTRLLAYHEIIWI